ncbi:MAG: caspase family protein [Planctomycetes bacterium]|nr:caspase family protein [Planctomycetota bacterium]
MLIGVEDYENIEPLNGPRKDLDILSDLLSYDPQRGIIPRDSVFRLDSPSCAEFRQSLLDRLNESDPGDVLILYFSGHGSNVSHDFAFCLKDTSVYEDVAVSLTVVKFSELMETFDLFQVTPIFIIDACYSGAVAGIHPSESTIASMKREIKIVGGRYALLCSCNERQTTSTTTDGGDFTRSLVNAVKNNLYGSQKPYISISDIEDHLRRELESSGLNNIPKIVLGDSLPDVAICRNPQFQSRKYRLSGRLLSVLTFLWNGGNHRTARNDEILNEFGPGAYANNNKLSYGPWSLAKKTASGSGMTLTENGIKLMSGEISVHEVILKDPFSSAYFPDPAARKISFINNQFAHL